MSCDYLLCFEAELSGSRWDYKREQRRPQPEKTLGRAQGCRPQPTTSEDSEMSRSAYRECG